MFTYPMLRFVLGFVMAILVLSLLASAVMHYLFGGVRLQSAGERISVAARVHLSVLIGLIVLAKAVGYWLDRYGLLYSLRGVVQGGSYTDINAVLPAKTLLVGIAIICGLLFFANIIVRNVLLPAGALALLVVSSIALGGIYPALVQQFQVKPNEVAKESEYIERNIDGDPGGVLRSTTSTSSSTTRSRRPTRRRCATTSGRSRTRGCSTRTSSGRRSRTTRRSATTSGSTPRSTSTGTRSTARRRTTSSRCARWTSRGCRQDQRNWINLHLTYTHGNGFAAAPANRRPTTGRRCSR